MRCAQTSEDYLQVPEADSDGQFESVGSSEKSESPFLVRQESEVVGSSEKSRKRGKDLNWQEVERFDSPQEFNRSEMKVKLDREMRKNRVYTSGGARNQGYVCKVFRKQGWKSCPFKFRVSLLSILLCVHVSMNLR